MTEAPRFIRRCLLLVLTLALAGCVGSGVPDVQPQPDAGHDTGTEPGDVGDADAGDEGDADAGDEGDADAGDDGDADAGDDGDADAGDGDADAGDDGDADAGDGGDADAGDGGDADAGDGGDADAGDDGYDVDPNEPPGLEGILAAHNVAREAEGVGLPALTWDPLLATIAEDWAARCETSDGEVLAHNPNRSSTYNGYVGENIASTQAPTLSGPDAVGIWMQEKLGDTYDPGQCSGGCGHYTQIIWRDTLRVGCATVFCEGLVYPRNVVCNYAPGGNYIGQDPY